MEKRGIKSQKRKILIIEASKEDYRKIEEILSGIYRVKQLLPGEEHLLLAIEEYVPDLILLDTDVTEKSWNKIAKKIKENKKTVNIPIIFINRADERAEVEKGFQMGCADYVRKPFEPDIMRSKISTQIELYNYRHKMEEMLEVEKRKVLQITLEAITAIARAEEAKDSYTNAHSERVAEWAVKIAEKLGWCAEELEQLRYQALLHDIGKIGIPDRILNKHKNLTDEEYEVMKQHVKIGHDILKNFTGVEGLSEGALYHHERWDGKGYLFGKKGEEIPPAARIIAVADAYDAMSFERVYRGQLDEEYVIRELKSGSGTQFDPDVVAVMLEILQEK